MPGRCAVALALAAVLGLPAAASAVEGGLWTASCVKQGRVLFRERLAARPSGEREAELSRRYPGAVCMVLAPDPGGTAALGLGEALQAARPVGPPAGREGDGIGNVLGFDAAIRVLRGEAIPVSPVASAPSTGPVRPDERPGVEVETAPEAASVRPASGRYVRLALYEGDSFEDIMADWQRVSAAGPEIALYSPSLTRTAEGLTMLSVGPVSADERKGLCLSAAVLGLDCMPGPSAEPQTGGAIEALERNYPGLVTWAPRPATSARALGLPNAVDGTLSCLSGAALARAPGIDLLALGPSPAPAPAISAVGAPHRGAKTGPSASGSSMSKSPSSSLRKAFSAKARIRSASAPTVATAAPPDTTVSIAP